MNDIIFFKEIVAPTVAEFLEDSLNIRRAVIACVIVSAMTEHYFVHNASNHDNIFGCETVSTFKAELYKRNWALMHVTDIANGIKHVVRRQPGQLGYSQVLRIQELGLCGMRCGEPISGEAIFSDDSRDWMLTTIMEHVLTWWRDRLGI